MIKLIETASFKDGRETTTHTKVFPSWADFKRKIVKSQLTTELCYKLTKHREAFIDYEDGRVHLKVVEEPDKLKIVDSTGKELTRDEPNATESEAAQG